MYINVYLDAGPFTATEEDLFCSFSNREHIPRTGDYLLVKPNLENKFERKEIRVHVYRVEWIDSLKAVNVYVDRT